VRVKLTLACSQREDNLLFVRGEKGRKGISLRGARIPGGNLQRFGAGDDDRNSSSASVEGAKKEEVDDLFPAKEEPQVLTGTNPQN